jgi:transposase InsO family protein
MIIDLFTRKIVGWEVWDKESGDYAVTLVDRAVLAEHCRTILRVLHGDNGAIQKSFTLLGPSWMLSVYWPHSIVRVSVTTMRTVRPYFAPASTDRIFRSTGLPRSKRHGFGCMPSCNGTTTSIDTARSSSSYRLSGMRVLTRTSSLRAENSTTRQRLPTRGAGQGRRGTGIPSPKCISTNGRTKQMLIVRPSTQICLSTIGTWHFCHEWITRI